MGPQEKALRDQYKALCTDLGDAFTSKRHAEKKIADIEGEIDRLQAALPDAQRVDQAQLRGRADGNDQADQKAAGGVQGSEGNGAHLVSVPSNGHDVNPGAAG